MRFFSQHDVALVVLCLLPALVAAVALVRLAAHGARRPRHAALEPARVAAPASESLPETGEIVRA